MGGQLPPLALSTVLFLAIPPCSWQFWKPAPTPNIIAHVHAHQNDYSKAGVVSDKQPLFSRLLLTSPLEHCQLCLLAVSLQDAPWAPVPLVVWWRQQPMA